MRRKNKFLSTIADIGRSGNPFLTFAEPEGNDPGGGGGGGDPGNASAEPAGGGGAQAQDANFDFESASSAPSAAEVDNIRSILALEAQPDHKLSLDQISAALKFDPPMKKAAPTPAPAPAPAAAAPAATAAPKAPATTEPPKPLTGEDLVAALKTVIGGGAAPAPANPSNPNPTPPPRPFYGEANGVKGFKPAVQVDENLVRNLFGIEEGQAVPPQAATAVGDLVNGIMNTVMQDMTAVMGAYVRSQMQTIPQLVASQHESRTNTQKFHDRFSELNKPAFLGLTNHIATALRKDPQWAQVHPGDDRFLDELGNRVHAYLKSQMGFDVPRARPPVAQTPRLPAAPTAAKPAAPAVRTPFMTPGQTRPPAVAEDPSGQSADLLSFVI